MSQSASDMIKDIAVAIGLCIVIPALFHYGFEVIMPRPEFNSPSYATYNLIYFIFMSVSGLISLVAGSIIRMSGVGAGLMLGGIFMILMAYVSYWFKLYAAIKFVSLLLAAGTLGALGWYLHKDKK